MFDTHAHLNVDDFDADREAMIARAHAAGVETMLAVGCTAASSAACIALAEQYPSIYASVGIQPNYVAGVAADEWDRIVELASAPRVVAIGETGLDRHWHDTPFEMQQDYFDRHLRLARERGLPFIVHTRESDADVLAMLRAARQHWPLAGVMHSFTGTVETMTECVELGLHISFAGMVTFKKSNELRAVAAQVPDDRLLIETDSPYLSPHPLRGKRNEPAHLPNTAACLAAVRGTTVNQLAALTAANARRLFRID